MFRNTHSATVCQNSVFAKLSGCQNEVLEKKFAVLFLSFYVGDRETEKRKHTKWKKAQNPIKRVFFKVVIQKWKIEKNGFFFRKNCLPRFVSGREKNAHFRAHYQFWQKSVFWSKTVKTWKNYKNSGFSGNCPKPEMTPFFSKWCLFWHRWKGGFY